MIAQQYDQMIKYATAIRAGPVAALALRKAGIAATVYEAYPSTADGVGGTLAFVPNGVAALRIVDADEAMATIATRSHEWPWPWAASVSICPAWPTCRRCSW